MKFTQEHKDKISRALMGNKNGVGKRGRLHHAWKEEGISYSALHVWIRRNFGKRPKKCEKCHKKGYLGGRNWTIQWANISKTYLRERKDWIPLCTQCHSKFDKKSENKKIWWQKRKQQMSVLSA